MQALLYETCHAVFHVLPYTVTAQHLQGRGRALMSITHVRADHQTRLQTRLQVFCLHHHPYNRLHRPLQYNPEQLFLIWCRRSKYSAHRRLSSHQPHQLQLLIFDSALRWQTVTSIRTGEDRRIPSYTLLSPVLAPRAPTALVSAPGETPPYRGPVPDATSPPRRPAVGLPELLSGSYPPMPTDAAASCYR